MLKFRDALRRRFGVHPAVVSAPLINANRCKSYHLEMRGGQGTYLGRQRIAHYPSGKTVLLRDAQYMIRSRQGQPFSHLYIRYGKDFGACFFENYFYEKAPGALARTGLASIGVTAVVWYAAVAKLGYGSGTPPQDLVAVLLAIPAVASAFATTDGSVGGASLAARFASIVTVCAALATAGLFVIAPSVDTTSTVPLLRRADAAVWVFIVFASTINTVASVASWLLRSSVQSYFTKSVPHARDIDIRLMGGNNVSDR